MRRSRRGNGSGWPSISGSRPSMKMRMRADLDVLVFFLDTAADGRDARQDLADVDRLANDVVDAGLEQHERVFEGVMFAERDNRRAGAVADLARRHGAVAAIADQECPDRLQILVGGRGHPLAEFVGPERGGCHALTVKK